MKFGVGCGVSTRYSRASIIVGRDSVHENILIRCVFVVNFFRGRLCTPAAYDAREEEQEEAPKFSSSLSGANFWVDCLDLLSLAAALDEFSKNFIRRRKIETFFGGVITIREKSSFSRHDQLHVLSEKDFSRRQINCSGFRDRHCLTA